MHQISIKTSHGQNTSKERKTLSRWRILSRIEIPASDGRIGGRCIRNDYSLRILGSQESKPEFGNPATGILG
jgi:hypothetical protein